REQIVEVMKFQARWVAAISQAENRQTSFPYPAFLSLCFPAYNENSNIEDTLTAACAMLPEFVERFEIVVVDDGSKDGTGATVEHFAEQEPRVRLIRHERNRGYGAAVTSGIRAAGGDLVAF